MNELIGMGWFFIVAIIMGACVYVIPKLFNYIKQVIKWRMFLKKTDLNYDYED